MWCVRPDGAVLLQCRIGAVDVGRISSDAPLELLHGSIDIYPDRIDIVLQVATTDPAGYTMTGHTDLFARPAGGGELVAPPVTIADYSLLDGVERVPTDDEDIELTTETDLLLYHALPASTEAEEFVGHPFLELAWEGDALTVALQGPDWFT